MRVSKLKLGVYFHANVGSNFCLYTFPKLTPSDQTSLNSNTEDPSSPDTFDFYCLKDVDILFFHKDPGYLISTQNVNSRFLHSPRHCFRENTGAVYLSAAALAEVASNLKNRLLSQLCALTRQKIIDGQAESVLSEVKGLTWKHPFAVSDEDLEPEAAGQPIPDAPVSIFDNAQQQQGQGTAGSSAGSMVDDESGVDAVMSEANEADGTSDAASKRLPAKTTPSDGDLGTVVSHKRPRSDADQASGLPSEPSPHSTDEEPQSRPKQRKRLSINTAFATNVPFRVPVGPADSRNWQMGPVASTDMPAPDAKQRHHHNMTGSAAGFEGDNRYRQIPASDNMHSGNDQPLLSPRHLSAAVAKPQKASSRGYKSVHSSPGQNSELMSPRTNEFPSRELPLPGNFDRPMDPRSPLPPMSTSNTPPQRAPFGLASIPPPPSPSSAHPSAAHHFALPTIPRATFMSMCEALYEQMEEVPRLQHTLREQIRKSTALLQTLQASGQMIEGLVRSHFREMQVAYGEKFGAAVTDLHRRLCAVEERVEIVPGTPGPSGAFVNAGGLRSAGINGAPGGSFRDGSKAPVGIENMLSSIVDRLAALEKKSGEE